MFTAIYAAPRETVLDTYTPSAARLRDRVAFGSYSDLDEITAQGSIAWLDNILAMEHDSPLATVRRTGMTWPTGYTETDYPPSYFLYPQNVNIARIIARKDAIRGMMAEFWLNHLVPGNQGDATPEWFPSYRSLNQYFWENALGNFEGLLTRFLRSVPLQHFMTNFLNTVNSKNENLGREYLELFALGLAEDNEDPRYDPIFDVLAVTDIMTGHGVRVAPTGSLIDGDTGYRNPYLLNQSGSGLQTFYNDSNVALAGGSITFYEPGTSTLKTIWSNRQKTVTKANPVTLDGSGQATIFGTGPYRILAKNSGGTTVWDLTAPQTWTGTNHESFWFTPANHDGDEVTVTFLPGIVFSNAEDGAGTAGTDNHPSLTKLIYHTVRHRASARFICVKMATFFLGTTPTPLVREAMINTYLAAVDDDDQIAQTLRVLFLSKDFCTSYCDNARALTPLMWYSKLFSFFGDDAPHSSSPSGYKALDKIQSYCDVDEGYFTGRYQTPAGYPDFPAHWLSPGNLTGRAVNCNTIVASAVSSTSNYATKLGISTPQQFLDRINTHFLGGRATQAQLEALGDAFTDRGFALNSAIANWAVNNVRAAIREVFAAMSITDLAQIAE